jgi:hypothetical protein
MIAGAFLYWQLNKKKIIARSIESAVSKKTDSLYYIKYDSSAIDELNGNASFYNVVLQSDSVANHIASDDTSNNIMYDVRVGEVAVKGVNIPGLLAGKNIEARSIHIIHPDIQIIRLGNKTDEAMSRDDSVAVYEKILGKFKSIKATEIVVEGGKVSFSNKTAQPHTTLQDINLTLDNFRVDSTKDYSNLVSYFVKGLHATVGETVFKSAGGVLSFDQVEYDATRRFVKVRKFQQRNPAGQLVSAINNIAITGLSTNAFIVDQKLIADSLSADGGTLTVYRKKAANNNDEIELDSSFFDKAVLRTVRLGSTRVSVYNKDNPAEAPMVLNNIKFSASDIPVVSSGNHLKNIISNSKWLLSGDGLSSLTKDKVYKISLGPFIIDHYNERVSVQQISIVPQISEAAFYKMHKVQKDIYDFNFKNLVATGVDINTFIAQRILHAGNLSLQPILKIYSDRTIPPDPKSKFGKYPHQTVQKMKTQLDVRKVQINNGFVQYRERGVLTGQIGSIFFDKLNGTMENVTNIPGSISKTPTATVTASAMFMGVNNFTTKWNMPLNSNNGAFTLVGKLGAMDGRILNAALEPLGKASIRQGTIKGFDFTVSGNDSSAHPKVTLLYNDLKIDFLKKESDENDLQRRKALSTLANIIIRNDNPHNGVVRKNETYYQREMNRSFFYLVWKSVFTAAQKTVTGKNNLN